MNTVITPEQIHRKPIEVPKHPVWPNLTDEQTTSLKDRIKGLLKRENAVLVAHYYIDGDLQALAEETGGCVADSLEMARYGTTTDADTLVVCGVRFMGETAKILNPEKRVLMPDLTATCSLDEGCPADEFRAFCDAHPDHTVVVYANTSAAVKARADWMVTSGIALPIVKHLAEQGEKILWAPDKHLGHYIRKHDRSRHAAVARRLRGTRGVQVRRPGTAAQAAPGCRRTGAPGIARRGVDQADVVGSTTALIKAVRDMPNKEFIVATDDGIFWKMHQLAPDKKLISAPTAGEGAHLRVLRPLSLDGDELAAEPGTGPGTR